ncbi:hypothetical protein Q9L58_010417, partial [Maublancomyces gigas]
MADEIKRAEATIARLCQHRNELQTALAAGTNAPPPPLRTRTSLSQFILNLKDKLRNNADRILSEVAKVDYRGTQHHHCLRPHDQNKEVFGDPNPINTTTCELQALKQDNADFVTHIVAKLKFNEAAQSAMEQSMSEGSEDAMVTIFVEGKTYRNTSLSSRNLTTTNVPAKRTKQ